MYALAGNEHPPELMLPDRWTGPRQVWVDLELAKAFAPELLQWKIQPNALVGIMGSPPRLRLGLRIDGHLDCSREIPTQVAGRSVWALLRYSCYNPPYGQLLISFWVGCRDHTDLLWLRLKLPVAAGCSDLRWAAE